MAPDASERTAFQKNTGSDTVAVVYTEFLYVKYSSVHFTFTSLQMHFNTKNEILQYYTIYPYFLASE